MLLLDVTDTTMASTGTDKGITVANSCSLRRNSQAALSPRPATAYARQPQHVLASASVWGPGQPRNSVPLGLLGCTPERRLLDLGRLRRKPRAAIGIGAGGSVPQPISGNIWNGTALQSYNDTYAPAPGEWVHVALGWDGTYLYMYVNGIINTYMLFSGPRLSPGLSGCGPLFVGGSDHLNLTANLAFLRGWDQYNPIAATGNSFAAFIPDRFPYRYSLSPTGILTPCDFYCDYTAPAGMTCLDTSPAGYNSGLGYRTFHHGVLGNDLGTSGALTEWPLFEAGTSAPYYLPPWTQSPVPSWVVDPVCPLNVCLGLSPAPAGTILTPLAVPSGAKVFDSFQRPNQTFAFQANPTLGSTEGGSMGPQVWSQGSGGPYGAGSPNYCSWGILAGQAVPLCIGCSTAW